MGLYPKILLPVVGNRVLIFDLEEVKRLRKLGICGVLSGTLSAAPQQNVFLGLPLELSFEDTIWLVEKGHGVLVDSVKYHTLSMDSISLKEWNGAQKVAVADENHDAILIRKLEALNLSKDQLEARKEQLKLANKENNFIQIPNTTAALAPEKLHEVIILLDEFIQLKSKSNEQLRKEIINYHVYRTVKDQGYYLLPGLRFGGKFIGYPNDPLRYHAHYIIKHAEDFDLLDLVTGGRLATGVKKVWVLVGDTLGESKEMTNDQEPTVEDFTKESKQQCFSIEWAGFG